VDIAHSGNCAFVFPWFSLGGKAQEMSSRETACRGDAIPFCLREAVNTAVAIAGLIRSACAGFAMTDNVDS